MHTLRLGFELEQLSQSSNARAICHFLASWGFFSDFKDLEEMASSEELKRPNNATAYCGVQEDAGVSAGDA